MVPWGEEALEKAKKKDKPVLVSIGYAAGHWCRVMERESFENEETARQMLLQVNGHIHTKTALPNIPAFLDDYAYLLSAYIHLQEITGNAEYLHKAKKLAGIAEENFLEENSGFYFFTSKIQKDVIVRKKEVYDGATPSGNSAMVINLHCLVIIFNEPKWIEQARNIAEQIGNAVTRYPFSFANWAGLLQQFIYGVPEIAITGDTAFTTLPQVLQEYIPIKVQAAIFPEKAFPLLHGKSFKSSSLIYVCQDYSCKKPVESIKEIKSLLI